MSHHRKLGKIHRLANRHDAGVTQPFDTTPIILISSPLGNRRKLKLLVFLSQLGGYALKDIQDSNRIEALGILSNIGTIIGQDSSLHGRNTLEGPFHKIRFDNLRHAAQDTIIQKKSIKRVLDGIPETYITPSTTAITFL